MATFPSSDASSPPVVKQATSANVTTAAFSPPANSVIVVSFSSDGQGNGAMTLTNTGGLTFNLIVDRRVNTPAGAEEGHVGLWWASVGSTPPTNMTITVDNAESSSTLPQMLIARVYTADQVDISDPIGAMVQGNMPAASSWSTSITPETSNGGIRAVYLDWNATGTPATFTADTELVDGYHVNGLSTNVQIGKQVPTVAGVAETIGANAGTVAPPLGSGNWVAYELRAAPQPVAAYAMDENTGTLIADNGGSGRNLTRGTAMWATGRHGSGLTGVDSGAGATGAPFPAGTYTEFSIVVDVKLNSVEGNFSSIVENPTNTSLYLEIDEGGIPDAFVRGTSGGTALATAPSALTPGTWYTLAATFTNTGTTNNMRLYRDGVQVATGNRTSDLTAVALGGATLSVAGSVLQPSGATIDNLRFYSTALTAGQVAALTNTAVGGGGQQPVTGPAFDADAFSSQAFYTSDGEAYTGSVALTGSGSLTLTGAPAVSRPLALTGSGTLTTSGVPAAAGGLTLAGSGTLSTTRTVAVGGALALSGSGTLTASGVPGWGGALALTGAGTLTLGGTPAPTAALPLTGSGTLALAGTPRPVATLALTGTGALTFTATTTTSGTLALAGTGTLLLTGAPAVTRPLALSGSGTLGLTGAATQASTGSIALTGTGTLTLAATPALTAALSLSGTGTLAFTRAVAVAGTLPLTGSGTLGLTGGPQLAAALALTGSGTLTLGSVPRPTATIALSGSGTLAFGRQIAVTGALALTGDGSLGLVGSASQAGQASMGLTGSGTLTFGRSVAVSGALARTGSGTLTLTGAPSVSRTLTLTGSGSLATAGTPAVARTLALTGSGTLTGLSQLVTAAGTLLLTGTGTLSGSGSTTEARVGAIGLSGSGTLALAGRPAGVGTLARTGSGALTVTGRAGGLGGLHRTGSGTLSTATVVSVYDQIDLTGAGSLSTGVVTVDITHVLALSGTGTLDLLYIPPLPPNLPPHVRRLESLYASHAVLSLYTSNDVEPLTHTHLLEHVRTLHSLEPVGTSGTLLLVTPEER